MKSIKKKLRLLNPRFHSEFLDRLDQQLFSQLGSERYNYIEKHVDRLYWDLYTPIRRQLERPHEID